MHTSISRGGPRGREGDDDDDLDMPNRCGVERRAILGDGAPRLSDRMDAIVRVQCCAGGDEMGGEFSAVRGQRDGRVC